jgi:hypothetical protein
MEKEERRRDIPKIAINLTHVFSQVITCLFIILSVDFSFFLPGLYVVAR